MHGGEAATNWVKNYKNCEKCLKCADVCPYMALNVSSKIMSDEQVVKSVMKDEVFYRNTGGGITLSGGEPLLQADFSAEILSKIQAAGISTAIETAGFVTFAKIEKVLPYTDLFLYDIKAIDQGTHKKYTGVDNAQILRNVRKLARMGKEIIVRVPLIPGVNDGAEFTKIADFAKSLDTVQELHIMPFHNVGADKYRQMGLHYEMGDVKEDNEEKVEEARIYAESLGLRVSIGGSGY
jgi:pyruvate formate lyase activating enzyme